jgi:hypothetical protein
MRNGIVNVCLVLMLGLVAGCGGSTTRVRVGPMPEGASFHGVWMSPQYGNMHLCVSGNHVHGDYEKNERQGTIVGTFEGNVMRFRWEQSREFIPGRPMVTYGHGYFQLSLEADGDQYIVGEWGHDDADNGGGPWNAVKLRNRTPDRCSGAADPNEAEEAPEVSWDEED